MEIDLKIDRITISGKIKNTLQHTWSTLQGANAEARLELTAGMPAAIWRANDEMSAFSLVRLTEDGEVSENIAYFSRNEYQSNGWRLDSSIHFETEAEKNMAVTAVSLLTDAHFTRLDIAFDIFNSPFPNMQHRLLHFGSTSRQVGELYMGRMLNLQTAYWGARASEKQVRYYDKVAERTAKRRREEIPEGVEQWERLELQLRGKRPDDWTASAREMLSEFALPDLQQLPFMDRMVIHGLLDGTGRWDELGKTTRAKYRKLMKAGEGFDHTLAEQLMALLEARKNDLNEELKSYLKSWKSDAEIMAAMQAEWQQQVKEAGE